MFARLRKLGPAAAGLIVLALILLLKWIDPAPLERLRLQVFDAYQVYHPRDPALGQGVTVVDIDEKSIAEIGQWPWPRTDIATLTRRLGEAGAAAVVYDVVFSEPDRTSPAEIAARYEGVEGTEELRAVLSGLPDNDEALAQSFAEVPVVTGYFFLDPGEAGREVEPKASFTVRGSLPTRKVPSYGPALLPLPILEEASQGLGFVTLDGDADGIVRRVPLLALQEGVPVPSLTLEAVRVARDASSPSLLTSDGSGETLASPGAAVSITLDGIAIPVNDAGEMWVHFPEEREGDLLPAWRIVTGDMAVDELRAQVEGRIVFVGGSAEGLQDLVSTPLVPSVGGVTAHAAAAEQILAEHFLERPDWASGLELILLVVLAGGLAFALPRLGATKGALAAIVGISGVATLSWFAFTRANYLLDPTFPVLGIAAVYVVQTVAAFYREERQRSYIRSAFDRYLSPELVRQIAADPHKLELGGEERDMSVLMCDIRGFSRISERYKPNEVIDFLIDFLTPMSDLLMERRATLDKYIGDAILAFWNAPLDDPDHHRNAARAALEMIAKTEELNRTMPGREGATWPGEVKIGIGLNSGLCCVGNMGSRKRLSYSIIGDTVNMASRLEGLTKQYGVPIVIGSALAAELQDFALLELDRVRVVGRDAPETIFALLGDEQTAAQERFQDLARSHAAMLAAYRAQDWDAAQIALNRGVPAYAEFGIAGLCELFAARFSGLRANPPGARWDGVFQATEK
jgi:adenylate cyclase